MIYYIQTLADAPAPADNITEHVKMPVALQFSFSKAHLQGSIPDMTAKTATYLELQQLYRERAEKDIAALKDHVSQIEARIAVSQSKISSTYIRLFAKNARNIR